VAGGPTSNGLLARLRTQPGGAQLLKLAAQRQAAQRGDVHLVGGAVRDLLLARAPRELDVVVAADAESFAQAAALLAGELASSLPGGTVAAEHQRFGTALVQWDAGRIDIAAARRERYAHPGALPEVQAAALPDDLRRRDFTVNAIATALAGAQAEELQAVPQALDDLRQARLRVLHEHSFLDDPTRLLRLARYSARLGFTVEDHTAQLAAHALRTEALASISGARIGAELGLALSEASAPAALAAMQELGVLSAIHPRLRHDAALAQRALELFPADGSRRALLLAALLLPLTMRVDSQPAAEAQALLDRLEFPAGERDLAVSAAIAATRLLDELPTCTNVAALYHAAHRSPSEGVALAGALAGAAGAQAARRWLEEVRHIHLAITGDDLIAAGIAQGPEVGRRLQETLILRLNGELGEEREAQLRAALASEGPHV
jgi:tRNA nucleotidyltransferase (CCA-adding enzyme)